MLLTSHIPPLVLAIVVAATGVVRAGDDESADAYDIVVVTAVNALPEPLHASFQANLITIKAAAAPAIGPTPESGIPGGDADRHYVFLDAAAGTQASAEDRQRAASAFPHDRREAGRICRQHGREHCGDLPWVIGEQYTALLQVFQGGDQAVILREAGMLLHFATDASLPFHTTRERDGGSLHWAASQATPTNRVHRTVGHRCQIALIREFRGRFEAEVRVWPGRLQRVTDPIESVFEALLCTHEMIEPLVRMDADAATVAGIQSDGASDAAWDAFYRQLSIQAAPIMEARLEAGALLGASLIRSAWLEAGSPRLPMGIAAESAPRTPPAKAETPGGRLVGSRNSTTFHDSGCIHVARIKAENLIVFDSIDAAKAAGRMACQTCKPGGK